MRNELLINPSENMAVYSVLRRLEGQARQIRVGVVGAGATGRAIALQLGTPVPGIRLVAMSNRTIAHAERAYVEAGILYIACMHGWMMAMQVVALSIVLIFMVKSL